MIEQLKELDWITIIIGRYVFTMTIIKIGVILFYGAIGGFDSSIPEDKEPEDEPDKDE